MTCGAVLGIGVERVRVVARGRRWSGPCRSDLGRELGRLARAQVGDVDVAGPGVAPASGRWFAASTRSRCSRSRCRRSSRRPHRAASRGTGAVSRPRLHQTVSPMVRADRDRRRGTTSTQRPSARALGDRVVDQHLVVAVGECRIGRPFGRSTCRDVVVDGPEMGGERVAEALDVAARERRRGTSGRRHECGVLDAGSRWVARDDRSTSGRAAPSPMRPRRRTRRSRTAVSSCARR